eukprot:gene4645-6174_t
MRGAAAKTQATAAPARSAGDGAQLGRGAATRAELMRDA